ncbi:DUF1150 family protein [Roseomonas gilardii]|nr:DUF1150 family protein [Roseomonas gilardii]APT56908.1 hypothetical protein RGI145_07140 [Roseomonas gilardii]PZP42795.1 MAG: DUF1150 domain-containing protein [Azospirillum brasilense]PZR10884.1 MAG: DUF1150 domain-containing protein [Azospirillum brasilense]SUE44436.1 Uncharacterized small protein [Roseomonas gilardii subsp. rosea]
MNESREARETTVLKGLSPADWASFGREQIAYIRPVVVDGVKAVAIHSADGTPIGAAPTADLAIAAIIQNEMEPVLVH